MKKLLTLTLTLLMLLSLTACNNDIDAEPPAPADATKEGSKYADHNNDDDRYFKSVSSWGEVVVYGNDCYYGSNSCAIVTVPLPTGGETVRVTPQAVCADAMCDHVNLGCPAYMRDPEALFLLDSLESGGDHPVFYYSRCTADEIDFGSSSWGSGQNYEIVRYDSAQGKAESVASVNYPIRQFMTYRDRVYFIAQTGAEKYELYSVLKTGGEVTTLSPGGSCLNLIGANKNGVYVNDEKGNVYALGHAFENDALIYTVEEVYPLVSYAVSELDMFVDDDYLYFYSDFETLSLPLDPSDPSNTNSYRFVKHSIRRVRLDSPNGEGEVIAENVYKRSVYGIYNGVLYYGPFDVDTGFFYADDQFEADNHTSSNGTIIGVNLDTLESFEVINDCGYNIEVPSYYINDRCIVTYMHPYRNGMGISTRVSGGFPSLLDFETGALYNVYNGVRLYDGTLEK